MSPFRSFMRGRGSMDKPLLIILIALLGVGIVAFLSASLGELAREGTISSTLFSHLVLGIGLGLVLALIASRISYRRWKPLAPYLFGASLIATALVFVPGISFEHGGAQRWLLIGPASVQPSEFLKVGAVFFYAFYLAKFHTKLGTWRYGLGGFLLTLAAPAALLLLQPDTGTLGIIALTALCMFIAAGARWRQIFAIAGIGIVLLGMLAIFRPYVLARITTFLDPEANQHGSGYQVQQSLLAIGSGGITGRGLGQGIQKFSYLPEPMSDSIYAVIGEEFGLIGTTTVLALFLAFAARGLSIAARAPDQFGALLAVGIAAYISIEALVNIAAMLGLIPLTGIPLLFISQGGTAMLVALGSVGVLLNISSSARKPAS